MSSANVSRRYTRRLSELLSSSDGTLTLVTLQKLRGHAPTVSPAPLPRPQRGTVGVWRREGADYVRDPNRRSEWRYWADVERLSLPEGRRRVVLLGESVARGYFYDPETTFASLLDDCLRRVCGLDDVDVIDLARSNASPHIFMRTLLEAAELRPDAIIVFAGNNWNGFDLNIDRRQALADALRDGGYPAAQSLTHGYVVEYAGQAMDVLADVAQMLAATVAVIIPEVNIADWVHGYSMVCPTLRGDNAQRTWLETRRLAEQALADGHAEKAANLAGEMVKLDGGTSPVSQRLLATTLAMTDPATAERALIAAKDAWVFNVELPRVLTAVQDKMRQKTTEHGFVQVDLARELRAAAGAPPGRRFFLDYCHLTFEGLALTAAITASRLASPLGAKETPAELLYTGVPKSEASTAATAHFLAAIINANCGQPTGIVRHHLERALEKDPDVAEQLHDYLDYQTRIAPRWMCATFARSQASPKMARYLMIDERGELVLANHGFYDLIADLIGDTEEHEKRLISEHVTPQVDLLADRQRVTTYHEHHVGVGRLRAFLIAEDLESDFHYVMAEPAYVDLAITWRLPAGDPDTDEASVHVNGVTVGSASVSRKWTTTMITVPLDHWRRGRNIIKIRWPLRTFPGDDLVKEAAESLERGTLPEPQPGHGHIFAFTATHR